MSTLQDSSPLVIELPKSIPSMTLTDLYGTERISDLFHFELTLRADEDLTLDEANKAVRDLLKEDKNVSFGIHGENGESRMFNGIIVGATCTNTHDFRITIAPWLWLLTRGMDSRVYADKTGPEVVARLFDQLGFHDYRMTFNPSSFPKRPQCVQYRETHANFISRLLEDEGIFYFWEHDGKQNKHTLVLTDSTAELKPCRDAIELLPVDSEGSLKDDDTILEWNQNHRLIAGQCVLHDYLHEKPHENMLVETRSISDNPRSKPLEIYDPLGKFRTRSDGQGRVQMRIEQEETSSHSITGAGDVRMLSAGGYFELANEQGKYLVTSVRHQAALGDFGYHNSFDCIPLPDKYRPARSTPQPNIAGIQTAIVTGPQGRETAVKPEVHTDEFGRVKVRFRWDRREDESQDSSCWIRVGQAGGQMRIPRIGEEVLVIFEQGDPERPLLIGSAFATPDLLHFPAEDNTHDVTLKQKFIDDGAVNQLRLHGNAGKEQVLFEAGRDLVEKAGRSRFSNVDGDQVFRTSGVGWHETGNTLVLKSDTAVHIVAPEIALVSEMGSFVQIGAAGVVVEGKPLVSMNCGNPQPVEPINPPEPDPL